MKLLSSAGIQNLQRKRIYKRDGWACALCGSNDGMQIHHVVPRGKGGSDLDENLICLCRFCHALAHGIKLRDYCDMEPEGMEHMMVEYLSEFYIEYELVWNPWGNYHIENGHLKADETNEDDSWVVPRWSKEELYNPYIPF